MAASYEHRKDHHYQHHHWQNSPLWAMDFLRTFSQIASGFHFSGFRDNNFFTRQDRQPVIQPPT
jgi:hypothetical protein